jgi:NADH:ubiquinone oxidoreductase subunit 6 (subunit J)
MSEEKSTAADIRVLLQATLLVLGSGLTLLSGWAIGGVVGVVCAALAVLVFFLFLKSTASEAKKKGEATGPSTAGVVWYAIYTFGVLIIFLANS